MRNATFLIIGLALFFGACKSPTEPDLSQDLGVVLTEPIMRETNIVWSPDSREIFYVSVSNGQLRAVDVMSKSGRNVEAIYQNYLPYGSSYDGKYLYYSAVDGGIVNLYRLAFNGQNAERIVQNIGIDTYRDKPLMTPSPDNIHLAYMTSKNQGDSLFLLNTTSRSRKYYTRGRPVCFSPDGSQLLLRRGYAPNDTLCILSLGDGNIQTIAFKLASAESWIIDMRWVNDGIRLLRYEISSYVVQSIPSNTNRSLLINDSYRWLGSITWSATGNKFALWSHECIKGQSWSSCAVEGYRLHLTALDASRSSLIAHGRAPGGSSPGYVMAFSPDNKKIACVFSQQIYVKDIP